MRTKFLFFLLIFVIGVGNGFAQSANQDSLLQENLKWDTLPGTQNEKIMAILTGNPVKISDSVVITKHRWLGFLYYSNTYYDRYISFDKKIKNFKIIAQKKYTEDSLILPIIYSLVIIAILAIITKKLYWENLSIGIWILWSIVVIVFVLLSYYLGSICAILSLVYIINGNIDDQKLKKILQNIKS